MPHQEYATVNVVGTDGPLWFYASFMFAFILALSNVAAEKENKLRAIMKTMGLYDSAYWFSWSITMLLQNTVSVAAIIIFGAILQFDFFLKNDFLTYFLLLELFALSLVPLVILISTMLSR